MTMRRRRRRLICYMVTWPQFCILVPHRTTRNILIVSLMHTHTHRQLRKVILQTINICARDTLRATYFCIIYSSASAALNVSIFIYIPIHKRQFNYCYILWVRKIPTLPTLTRISQASDNHISIRFDTLPLSHYIHTLNMSPSNESLSTWMRR